ncbi:tetratricopeptide repeat protein [Pseudothermotoga sp.]|uniref:tetratricopeptide repeat protein n=1 Tax=Pseudothermotoga sp. TaxID=2033661 RepID=UPI0031F61120
MENSASKPHRRWFEIKAIVFLPLKPDKAKQLNLPVKLPILAEDLPLVVDQNKIPLDVILRGLEAQCSVSKDPYYESYLVYFYYEKVKSVLNVDDLETANEYVEKAGRIEKDYRYDFFKGLIYVKKKEYELAEICFRSCISRNPNFPLAHYELGNILRARKEFEEAIEEYQKAFELEQSFLLPVVRIGDCYLEMGEVRIACDFYQIATQKDPNFQLAHARLGVACNMMQKYERAEKALKRALELNKEDFESAFNLTHTLSRLGKHFEALNLLKKLSERAPNDPILLNEYALCLRRLGFYEEAKIHIDKACQLSEDAFIHYNRALLTVFVDKKEGFELLKKVPQHFQPKAFELLDFLNDWRGPLKVSNCVEELVSKVKKCLVRGELNVQRLAFLLPENERSKQIREGLLPMQDERIDDANQMKLLLAVSLASSEDPIAMEKNVTKAVVAFCPSGTMLAVAIALTRLLMHVRTHAGFELEPYVNDVVFDLQEYCWEFAKKLSQVEDESFSMEEVEDRIFSSASELFLTLLKVLSVNPTFEEVIAMKDENLKCLCTNILEVIRCTTDSTF